MKRFFKKTIKKAENLRDEKAVEKSLELSKLDKNELLSMIKEYEPEQINGYTYAL